MTRRCFCGSWLAHTPAATCGRCGVTVTQPKRPKDSRRIPGGLARAASMSPERRAEIARAAATARWGRLSVREASES